MNFLRRFFPSFFPAPEPDWAALNRHWPDVTRGRWVAA